MYIMGTTDYRTDRVNVKGTLWHCDQCDSFVSIHSTNTLHEALCPTCDDIPLEFCGTFDSILGKRFLDA